MPFYEYQCTRCGHDVEVLQKISDPPLRKCPDCGRSALVKLVSAPVFRLKGSGWYETDFKSDKEGKRNLAGESDAGSESGTEAKTDGGAGEAKADAKPDKTDAATAKADSAAAKSEAPAKDKPAPASGAKPAEHARTRRTAARKPPAAVPKGKAVALAGKAGRKARG